MSAICAVYRFDGAPVSGGVIARLLEPMCAFGPEAFSWTPETPEAPVALGCRPMRVTPEDAFYQGPAQSTDGRAVLVADARIDNRSELASQLGWSSAEAGRRSDPEFILAAYEAWGRDCAPRLLGDFTVVIWDQRERRLFCARDGLGQRVLFYHESPLRLALATLPHALLAMGDVPARLNEQKVAESLVLVQDPATTFFSGVKRMPPGHTLIADPAGIRIERFWSPQPARSLELGSDQEYVDGFNAVFEAAVQARLRATGAIGIQLSGGLDSTSVAAVAAPALAAQGRRLRAYHSAPRLGFRGAVRTRLVADESADVEAVAACFPNVDLYIHRTNRRTPLDSAEQLFATAGLPVRNPVSMPWGEALYSAARADGVTVILNGNHGNNTISYDGVRSLRDLARRGRWRLMWRELQALARRTRDSRRDLLREQVLLPLLPPWLRRRSAGPRNLQEAAGALAEFSAIRPEFARATHVGERVLAQGFVSPRMRRAGSVEHRVAALQSPGDGPDFFNGLRAWFGIETREPASDLRVVEYCLAIPASQFLRNGRTRSLLRRAMTGRLPEQVVERDTIGAQAADWSETLPAMREEITSELARLDRNETASRCLDLGRLHSLVSQWPDPLRPEDSKLYADLLLRGVMMGRYIRWFEATYS